MNITKAEVEAGAFWDEWVCLDCGEVQLEGEMETCSSCRSSTGLLPCTLILRIFELVEPE